VKKDGTISGKKLMLLGGKIMKVNDKQTHYKWTWSAQENSIMGSGLIK
jgi:hypothetical protein